MEAVIIGSGKDELMIDIESGAHFFFQYPSKHLRSTGASIIVMQCPTSSNALSTVERVRQYLKSSSSHELDRQTPSANSRFPDIFGHVSSHRHLLCLAVHLT